MPRFREIRWLLVLPILLAVLAPVRAMAQDDPDEIPLGDVARNLRKDRLAARRVIDDDNLPQVMQQADRHQGFGSSLRYLMAGESKGFQVAAPDVTCSLAFTANVKALLASSQYAQMELPPTELAKLEGQAVIEGDALTVPVFNGTQWHVSELTVALTVVKRAESRATLLDDGAASDATTFPAIRKGIAASSFQQIRPEKKPDVTIIYRMRSAAPPWMKAVFSAPLDLEVAPGEEWHWAIVQARGYPPQTDAGPSAQLPERENGEAARAVPAVAAQAPVADSEALPPHKAQQ